MLSNNIRNKSEAIRARYRDRISYNLRRVHSNLTSYYDDKKPFFSRSTKSTHAAICARKSTKQPLEDYWLGLRLRDMDKPTIQVVRASDKTDDTTLSLREAYELHLRHKGVVKDRVLIRTGNQNTGKVTQLLADRPIPSYSPNEAIRRFVYSECAQKTLGQEVKVSEGLTIHNFTDTIEYVYSTFRFNVQEIT